jgi:type I restriction enzyme S subunit
MIDSWIQIAIGDLGKVVTGNTPPKKDPANYGGKYPFIKPTDMDIDRRHVTEWDENYSEKAFKRYHRSYIPPKATGVVTIGTVGEKIFQADKWCFTNQSVNVVIPNEELYDPDFVYFLLKVNLPKVLNANPGTASGRHHVSKSNFCSIKIRVPKSKENQRKIASILSAYDDLIENNLERIKLLEEKAQLTYEEWFVRMKFLGHETTPINEETGLPLGWQELSLNEVAEVNAKSLKKGFNGVIEYIDIASVSPGTIENTTRYTSNDAPGRAKRVGRHGDIIWSCVRPNRKSYAVIWNPKENLIASTGFCVITPKKLPTSYLLQFVTTNEYVGYLTNRAGGAAYPAVKAIDFKESTIVVPSKNIIEDFDDIFKNTLEVSWNLQNQNKHLKEARDILLPRLMTGMIDVEEVNLETLHPTTA